MINMDFKVQLKHNETKSEAMARTVTSPECLSASVLTICQNIDRSEVNGMVDELRKQTMAVINDDLSRAESMLTAQAHTLDGLFAKLTTYALTSKELDKFERYMKLALKAQSQARTTLQTLGELKSPKQIAFVRQANIGNQVQVNNDSKPSRARKNPKAPNELLEAHHGERLDTRAAGSTGGIDSTMATLETQHRPDQRRR